MIVKTNLFLIGGVVRRLQRTEKLEQLGGLYRSWPGLTVLFLISALALAGLPPFSGFWAKLLLIRAGLASEEWIIVAVSLAVSVLTLYSMTKIWNEAFWKEAGDEAFRPENAIPLPRRVAWSLMAPIVLLSTLAVGMGIVVEPSLQMVDAAAAQLVNPTGYIEAVLGTDVTSVVPRYTEQGHR
ncbi:hypothetical protein KFU94_65510 [Chloroflexi bacterium TSY]|nr:hypothetical protein [Chloroflexi bacterium TSY]